LAIDDSINAILHPEDDAAKAYIQRMNLLSSSLYMSNHVEDQEAAVSYLIKGGEYSAAIKRYKAILDFLRTNPLPDDMSQYTKSIYLIQRYYTIPVNIAICQMKEKCYTDALKTYEEIASNLQNTDLLKKTFLITVSDSDTSDDNVTIDKPETNHTAENQKNKKAIDGQKVADTTKYIFNDIAAAYYGRVDLQIRLAECLIKLREKSRAQKALTMAETQIKDTADQQNRFRHLSLYRGYIYDQDIEKQLSDVLPALQKDLDGLP